jgi:hypothetical protein
LNHPELFEKIRTNARRKIEEDFAYDKIISTFDLILRRLDIKSKKNR